MSTEFTASTVRLLKGAPLSCFLLMSLAGQPVTAEYLERNSGYSDKPVLAALRLLEEYGLITHNERYAWQIADGVRQIPLIAQGEFLEDSISHSQFGNQITNNEVEALAQSSDEEKQEDVTLENIEENVCSQGYEGIMESEQPQKEVTKNTRKNSDTEKFRVPSSRSLTLEVKQELKYPLLDRDDPEKLRVRNVLEALDRAGIREPKRSEIAQDRRVYPELVEYHVKTAPNCGMAIYRILHGWKIRSGWQAESMDDVRAQTHGKEPPVPDHLVSAWKRAQSSVETTMRAVDYQTWVAGLVVMGESDGVVSVDGHNDKTLAWVQEHCLTELQAGMSEALGRDVVIQLVKGW